ncbi:MAG: tetratricopeptide (TPR) repeat protein [Pseudohongiellaceae bacterium]|jgi:tetratricopeptide (TPR) repeat protein
MMNLTAMQAMQRGVAAHKEGSLNEAEQFYRTVLLSKSRYLKTARDIEIMAEAYTNLGVSLQQRGDRDAAIDSFKQAVKIKPNYIEVYYVMGHAFREKGDLISSIDCYQQAVSNNPGNADALINLGAALQHNGELEAAIESYKQALKISPECAEAYNNLGSTYLEKGYLDAAIESYKEAIKIKPDYANAYNNMGHAFHDKGDLAASLGCYKSALKIVPYSPQTHNNMGTALREIGDYQEAIKHFDCVASESDPSKPLFWLNSKAQSLECLYILGRYAELQERLRELAESGDINLRVAGVSAFVSNQLKHKDPYPFCKNPLDFFQAGNLSEHVLDVDGFVEDLMLEATKETQLWEPRHGVTKFGFQTAPTIFKAGKSCEALEKILRKGIASYHSNFSSEDCEYINSWPTEFYLRGWFVRLIKNGHQQSHNHPSGWLSGVVYLKTVDVIDSDEGAIELSLQGHDLPILDENYPLIVHRPKKGDIIFFPSSLYHRTIPFSEDTDRCVIAFDLYRH